MVHWKATKHPENLRTWLDELWMGAAPKGTRRRVLASGIVAGREYYAAVEELDAAGRRVFAATSELRYRSPIPGLGRERAAREDRIVQHRDVGEDEAPAIARCPSKVLQHLPEEAALGRHARAWRRRAHAAAAAQENARRLRRKGAVLRHEPGLDVAHPGSGMRRIGHLFLLGDESLKKVYCVDLGIECQLRPRDLEAMQEAPGEVDAVAPGGASALITAVRWNDPDLVERLVAAGANIDQMPGRTSALGASMGRENETSELLLRLGANTEVRDPLGQTPLLVAVKLGLKEKVQALLTYGADPHATTKAGIDAWEMARRMGRGGRRDEVLEILNAHQRKRVLGEKRADRVGEKTIVQDSARDGEAGPSL